MKNVLIGASVGAAAPAVVFGGGFAAYANFGAQGLLAYAILLCFAVGGACVGADW